MTKVNATTTISPSQVAALDEEGQIAVAMHQQAHKESAEARQDRRTAKRDEIRHLHRRADELRNAADRQRVVAGLQFAAAGCAALGQAMDLAGGNQLFGSCGKVVTNAVAIGKAATIAGEAVKMAKAGCEMAYNGKDVEANLAGIDVDRKVAQQRAEAAQEGVQHADKTAATAKDMMQKLAEARIRNMQIASRD
jgi:hypothetical protein